MTIKKSPKLIIVTVLFLIILLTIIISVFFNTNHQKSNDITNFKYPKLAEKNRIKEYENLELLENEVNFKLLHSNYFSNNNFEAVYMKCDGSVSEIYQIPKSVRKEYKENLDNINISEFLHSINEPYVRMTVVHSKDIKMDPSQFLGYYEIEKGFSLSNGQQIQVVKKTLDKSENPNYIICFHHNQVIYTIEKIPSREKAKEIANSFFIK